MMTGRRNGTSIQIATRVKLDIYGLMKRDAGKKCGVATVNNDILESHYAHELSKIRAKKPPTHARKSTG